MKAPTRARGAPVTESVLREAAFTPADCNTIARMDRLQESLLGLVVETSSNLPPDVRRAMASALGAEPPGSRSSQALQVIASNIDMASNCEGPICQDTGWPTFLVQTPVG